MRQGGKHPSRSLSRQSRLTMSVLTNNPSRPDCGMVAHGPGAGGPCTDRQGTDRWQTPESMRRSTLTARDFCTCLGARGQTTPRPLSRMCSMMQVFPGPRCSPTPKWSYMTRASTAHQPGGRHTTCSLSPQQPQTLSPALARARDQRVRNAPAGVRQARQRVRHSATLNPGPRARACP